MKKTLDLEQYFLNDYNIKEFCHLEPDLFPNFYIPFLNLFLSNLHRLLHKQKDLGFSLDYNNIYKELISDMYDEIKQLSVRVLIMELIELRNAGMLSGRSSEDRYQYFNKMLGEFDFHNNILVKYPVLLYLITVRINQTISLLDDFFCNAFTDKKSVYDTFKIDILYINNIKISDGDSHNNGKRPIILTSKGKKLIYKPHDMESDMLYNEIIKLANTNCNLKYELNSIKCLCKKGYGWQEFIAKKSSINIDEVKEYYYKIGAHLANFYVLKTNDLHYENLIASGKDPCFFDLETILQNNSRKKLNIYDQEINSSVLGTVLLPINIYGSSFDFDMSGLSKIDMSQSESFSSFTIVKKGTDKIAFEKAQSNVKHELNLVLLNGIEQKVKNFINEVLSGFEDNICFLITNKNEILNLLSNVDCSYRYIIRPTGLYGRCLAAATHPNYLKDFSSRRALFTKIMTSRNTDDEKDRINYEIESLMQNDIPYFSVIYSQKDLINMFGIVKDYFSVSTKQKMQSELMNLDRKDMQKQENYIRMSLATTILDDLTDANCHEKYKNRYFSNHSTLLDYCKEIGDSLLEMSIWNENKTQAGLFMLSPNEKNKLMMTPLGYKLYDSGGIILFLLHLGKETNIDSYINFAQCSLSNIDNSVPSIDYVGCSLFTGIGGLIYLHYTNYILFNSQYSIEKIKHYINQIENYDLEKENQFDIISGVTGTLKFLLEAYEKYPEYNFIKKTLLSKLSEFLFTKLKNNSIVTLNGLAHGYSGYAWTMIHAGKILQRKKYIDMGMNLIQKENSNFDDTTGNWMDLRHNIKTNDLVGWCHGAAGIALSRLNISNLLNGDNSIIESDIRTAIRAILNKGISYERSHCLCHGIFGNIDILLSIGLQSKDDSSLLKEVYTLSNLGIEYIKENGFNSGVVSGVDMTNFMLGTTGIGYSILRLHNPKIPSILEFKI